MSGVAALHAGALPRRVAAAFAELLTHEPFELTTFPSDAGYDELVVVRDISFHSLCMHLLLPFHGVAHVAHPPGERIAGPSKRGTLQDRLEPKGVGVVIEHLCMSPRGVPTPAATMTTSALPALLRDDARTRHEFVSIVTADVEGRSRRW